MRRGGDPRPPRASLDSTWVEEEEIEAKREALSYDRWHPGGNQDENGQG